MDTVTTAAAPASSQVTETYNWGGRQRAQFQADQDAAAKATGSDNVQLGFKDMLDLVNPLQHIPGVSNIYQAVTGDNNMNPAVKTVGDIVYGGPMGGVVSVFDNVFKQASGSDMMTTAANWVGLGDGSSDKQMAAAQTSSSTVVASASQTNTAAAVITNNSAPAPATTTAAANTNTNKMQTTMDIKPNIMALMTTLPNDPGAAATATTAAANPPAPDSALFDKLQRGQSPQGQVIGSTQQKFFNPTAKQFAGVTPATFKPSKDIANTPASIGLQANMQANDITKTAVQSSNSIIASSTAQANNQANNKAADTAQNPQSDFAQKMMAAMDRYEAAKKSGDASDAPAVSTGL